MVRNGGSYFEAEMTLYFSKHVKIHLGQNILARP